MSLLVSAPVHPTRDGSDLFTVARSAGIRPGWITPRAAFQTLLVGEAILLDLRPAADRDAGSAPTVPGAPAIVADQPLLDHGLDQLPLATPSSRRRTVIVLASDDDSAETGARSLQRRGIEATALAGGLPAWRSAGMPVAD